MAAFTLSRVLLSLSRLRPPPVRLQLSLLHRNNGTDFKSAYSLEKLYPNSIFNYRNLANSSQDSPNLNIPVDRLTITYSRSSGPGGQHVNKVNTKAEVRFHIATADWIPEDVKKEIIARHKNRINRSGELIVRSEVSRYQMRNLADCLEKIRDMVTEASQKPKAPSKEDVELRRIRVEVMNRERLKQKKINSTIKQSRRVDLD
ncbi:peptidyl-tRNA hydrolase ICT1, mitochondrial [Latimeria chalumnae]|uniref:Large ribosomal subunit protein mL62 n=1 Tax=Latimeria chalumnae TaxID=7897 RepID=H3AIK3_LATCH|nr:PREDICTED: peptidyl-tRNA hydrolase ICT1, mitochondrial [Latimeria chalumnae]|eukprot:XP_005998315.1 PREDICTED: peptidyl-tRNA hydrolase ICT1, mitochondrial [Latimeria chalumnae]